MSNNNFLQNVDPQAAIIEAVKKYLNPDPQSAIDKAVKQYLNPTPKNI